MSSFRVIGRVQDRVRLGRERIRVRVRVRVRVRGPLAGPFAQITLPTELGHDTEAVRAAISENMVNDRVQGQEFRARTRVSVSFQASRTRFSVSLWKRRMWKQQMWQRIRFMLGFIASQIGPSRCGKTAS